MSGWMDQGHCCSASLLGPVEGRRSLHMHKVNSLGRGLTEHPAKVRAAAVAVCSVSSGRRIAGFWLGDWSRRIAGFCGASTARIRFSVPMPLQHPELSKSSPFVTVSAGAKGCYLWRPSL